MFIIPQEYIIRQPCFVYILYSFTERERAALIHSLSGHKYRVLNGPKIEAQRAIETNLSVREIKIKNSMNKRLFKYYVICR